MGSESTLLHYRAGAMRVPRKTHAPLTLPGMLSTAHLDKIAAAVNAATPGSFAEVDMPFE